MGKRSLEIRLVGMVKTALFGSEDSTVSSGSSLWDLRAGCHPRGLSGAPSREGQRTWGKDSAQRALE